MLYRAAICFVDEEGKPHPDTNRARNEAVKLFKKYASAWGLELRGQLAHEAWEYGRWHGYCQEFSGSADVAHASCNCEIIEAPRPAYEQMRCREERVIRPAGSLGVAVDPGLYSRGVIA